MRKIITFILLALPFLVYSQGTVRQLRTSGDTLTQKNSDLYIYGVTKGGAEYVFRPSVVFAAAEDSLTKWATANQLLDSMENIKNHYVNVKDFGAVGDGETNDKDAIYNAIQSAITNNKTVLVPSGTYKMEDYIVFQSIDENKSIKIEGRGHPEFDFSSLTPSSSQFCFDFRSTPVSTAPTIDEAITAGQRYIIADSVDVDTNDVFKIWSDQPWGNLSESDDTTSYKGQLLTVRKLVGDTIFTYEDISTDYSQDETYARKINQISVSIDDIKIKGNKDNSNIKAIYVKHGANVTLSNMTVENCTYTGISLEECYQGNVFNNTVIRSNRGGTGYGIIMYSCAAINISNNTFIDCRHAVDCSGGFPTRYITIANNYIAQENPHSYGISTHASAEDIIIDGNWLDNCGIHYRGINGTISDNRIYAPTYSVAYYAIRARNQVQAEKARYIDIINNKIYTYDITDTDVSGIQYRDDGGVGTERVLIKDNIVKVNQDAIIIFAHDDTATIIDNLTIEGNDLYAYDSTSGYGIELYFSPEITEFRLIGNTINSNYTAVYYGAEDTIRRAYIRDNYIYGRAYTFNKAADNKVDELYIVNNHIKVDTADNDEPIFRSEDILYISHNVIENSRGYRFTGGSTDIYDYNNVFYNCPTAYNLTYTNLYRGWQEEKSDYEQIDSLSTSGASEVHWDNITNVSAETATGDSVVISADFNASHLYSSTLAAASEDTLVIEIYFTNTLDADQYGYGEFLITVARYQAGQQYAFSRGSFYSGGNDAGTFKSTGVNLDELANATVTQPTFEAVIDTEMDKTTLYLINNYTANPTHVTLSASNLYNVQSIKFSVQ